MIKKYSSFLQKSLEGNFNLVITRLNSSCSPPVQEALIQNAASVLLVDGGANNFLSFCQSNSIQLPRNIEVIGDLDSIRPEVQQFLESKGVKVLQDLDENCFDF